MKFNAKGLSFQSKVVGFFLLGSFCLLSCTKNKITHESPSSCPIQVLIGDSPHTFNPRQSLDATSQRLNRLLYRALTGFDIHLKTVPDLARAWSVTSDFKTWQFSFEPSSGLSDASSPRDHSGELITPEKMLQCLENYRVGKPTSLIAKSIPNWTSTTLKDKTLTLKLNQPNPYFAADVSLLVYFRLPDSKEPCTEPDFSKLRPNQLIGSGDYKLDPKFLNPEQNLGVIPILKNRHPIEFHFVTEENVAVFYALKNKADVIYNALSPEKHEWLERRLDNTYQTLLRDGTATQYLAFNLQDLILSKLNVRKAIAHALNLPLITRSKFKHYTKTAKSLLPPELPESAETKITGYTYDLKRSDVLLDEAGYKKNKHGRRFSLTYRTTSFKEAQDLAFIVRDALNRLGISVTIQIVEPAAFLPAIRKGDFQLYGSRWVGVKDASILERTLQSQSFDNRTHYQSTEMDKLLDHFNKTREFNDLVLIQQKVLDDLPYFPLWTWNHALFMRKELTGIEAADIPLDGSFLFLPKLRWSQCPH